MGLNEIMIIAAPMVVLGAAGIYGIFVFLRFLEREFGLTFFNKKQKGGNHGL